MYEMHRIFCATPGDLEEEREAFYRVVGNFNEKRAMEENILFVCVAITPTTVDTRAYSPVIRENIQSCRYYVQLLEDTWGPPQKNFEREYAIAQQCLGDSALPMREVVVLFKKPLLPHRVEESITKLKSEQAGSEFETTAEFGGMLEKLLEGWLNSLLVARSAEAR